MCQNGGEVVLSLNLFSCLTDSTERILDEADEAAEADDRRMTHDEVFGSLRRKLNAG